jgi:hypothetical protein
VSRATWGDPLNPYSGNVEGNYEMVLLKLDLTGEYQWHTFSESDMWGQGRQIALVDNMIFVPAMNTYSWGEPLNSFSGYWDMSVTKFDTDGSYLWHTYFGADDSKLSDHASGIISVGDFVYIVGMGGGNWGDPLYPFIGLGDIAVIKMADVSIEP